MNFIGKYSMRHSWNRKEWIVKNKIEEKELKVKK